MTDRAAFHTGSTYSRTRSIIRVRAAIVRLVILYTAASIYTRILILKFIS